ncbi:MAG TPA: nuclear transport factor 2 family protein [Pyrinomonadaceae bacterium]|jgi:ketosteroid isomerase-like protein
MRRLIVPTFVLLAAASSVAGQSTAGKNNRLEQEFMRRQRAQYEAEAKKDVAALDRFFDDDFIFVAANGAVYDRKKFLDEIKGDDSPPSGNTVAYEDFRARAYGKTAIVNYAPVVSGKDKDGKDFANRYRMSVVWIKQKGSWRITSFHATRVRT